MGFYSDSVLDEVRASVNIVSVVSEYVALKRRGRNHEARCPFHNEKTPSFKVNEEKQIFMCFGCGLGGDVFKFIMQIEHLTFPEAVRFIAERHGIRLPEVREPAAAVKGAGLDTLRKAMADAAAIYHRALMEPGEGEAALAYLKDRGVTRSTIAQFQLGYSPSAGDALIQAMKARGYTIEVLQECGLAKRSDDGTRYYDYFRGRILFPITDLQGRVVAFGGRAMGDKTPKYLNSPETKLYNKGRNLYGLSFSKEAIRARDQAVLVEGYMDFLIPFQHGVQNLVASLGTGLTQQQVELLGRYTREVVVSYDPDSAGVAAAQRSLDLFLEGDFRVKVLELPAGQDPDMFVRSAGAEAYRSRIQESVPYLEFILDTAIRNQGTLDDPKKKVQVMNAVLPYLAKLPTAVERSDYVFQFARRLGIDDRQLLAEIKKAAQQKKTRLEDRPAASASGMRIAEKGLLRMLLDNPELQPWILPGCSPRDFEGLASRRLFASLMDAFHENRRLAYEDLHRQFAGESEQALLAQLQIEEPAEEPSMETAESFLNALRVMRLTSDQQRIQMQIAEAAQRKDDAALNNLIEQRVRIDRELVSLSRK